MKKVFKFFDNIFSSIWAFFEEINIRWKAASPKLFVLIQRVSVMAALIGGLPAALMLAGLKVPPMLAIFADKALIIGAITAYVIAKLPVDSSKASDETMDKLNQ